MNINDIRRLNLDHIIGSPGKHGRIAEFAEKHGQDASYISQLLNKNRNMGEKAARKIERAIGLPPLTLDNPITNEIAEKSALYIAESSGAQALQLLELYLKASPEVQAMALHVLQIQQHSDTQKQSESR